MSSEQPTAAAADPAAKPRKKVRRAIGPKLRIVFSVVLALLAMIGANSVYLAGVTFLEWWTQQTYQDVFYTWMILLHIVLGLLVVCPFLVFGIIHMRNTKDRKIRRTVRIGYALFAVCLLVLTTGFLLVRVDGVIDLKHPQTRSVVYWGHVTLPVIGAWLYALHRLVGPKIRWRAGLGWGGLVAATAAAMLWMQSQDPRQWNVAGPKEGEKYFFPSLARTATGNFISAETLDMNEYCLKCHKEAHAQWSDSVHKFSSFNNPAYLASVAETREVAMKRDGDVQASRWCAGCHDPVPFFSGAFDDPKFDMIHHPTSQSGITCTVCHAITHVNSSAGNADFTIEEPQHYPFAFSENPLLQWVNNQLVKAKPSFHKKTFLKPAVHMSAEFCGACHKVHLPFALNHYKEFLRGQNHYDSWRLSGVSGQGTRSFYYPPAAETNCNGCHMPTVESTDFGARALDDSGILKAHDHLFPSANTAIAWLRGRDDIIRRHQEFLEGVMRVDIFGLRDGGTIDSDLIAPLRPAVPALQPGQEYVLETVIRTVKMGHHFTQGTTDSNEVWLEVSVDSGDKAIGRSGQMDDDLRVDPWSHYVNNFVLDREGNRIDRRNPQDIFVPLYKHQIPPGAGQTVHYRFRMPESVTAPVTVRVRLLYRKFDSTYMEFVDRKVTELGGPPIRGHQEGKPWRNELPVTVLCEDAIVFPVAGQEDTVAEQTTEIPEWQRWNDYGIGMLLKGKAALKQAAHAFRKVEELGRYDGPLNLARVLLVEAGDGQLDEAVEAVKRAASYEDPAAPPWTLAWLSGEVNMQQGYHKEAEENFRQALTYRTEESVRRKFNFAGDNVVINKLGEVIYNQALNVRGVSPEDQQRRQLLLQEAAKTYAQTLRVDPEDATAHSNLAQLYGPGLLDEPELARKHAEAFARYRVDDTARGRAVGKARERYPAADFAAEALVIYDLQRDLSGSPAKISAGPETPGATTTVDDAAE